MKRWLFGVLAVALTFGAIALAETVDLVNSPLAQWFQTGIYIGKGNGTATPSNQVGSNGIVLQVFGDAGFSGNMTITGQVVRGSSTSNGDLTVNGDAGVSNNALVSGALVATTLDAGATLLGAGGATVESAGNTTFDLAATVSGAFQATNGLNRIAGQMTSGSTFNVSNGSQCSCMLTSTCIVTDGGQPLFGSTSASTLTLTSNCGSANSAAQHDAGFVCVCL